jgi:hypothetical protein
MELQIIFDRPDRLYRFGESVSGKVLLQPDSDQTYSQIWLTYRWRTHGKGDRDEGPEQSLALALAEKQYVRAGESREFPFSFQAPNGPVTYHGHYLNVDWYLTAHAQCGPLSHLKSEQDFLLQAGDPTRPVVLGTKPTSKEPLEISFKALPPRPAAEPSRSDDLVEVKGAEIPKQLPQPVGSSTTQWGTIGIIAATFFLLLVVAWAAVTFEGLNWLLFLYLLGLALVAGAVIMVVRSAVKREWGQVADMLLALVILSVIGLAIYWSEREGINLDLYVWSAFCIALLAMLLIAGVRFILSSYAYKRKLELREVWVRPDLVYGGSEIRCHVDFVAKRGSHLLNVKATLVTRERVIYASGTTSVTEHHLLNEKTHARPFNQDLAEGSWIGFDCALPVAPDLPATFSSIHNHLEWMVTLKAELRNWPGWEKTFPVTVLPG